MGVWKFLGRRGLGDHKKIKEMYKAYKLESPRGRVVLEKFIPILGED